jgi:hypothetical protein
MSSTVYDAVNARAEWVERTQRSVIFIIFFVLFAVLIYLGITAPSSDAIVVVLALIVFDIAVAGARADIRMQRLTMCDRVTEKLKPAFETAAVIDAAVALGEVSGVTPAIVVPNCPGSCGRRDPWVFKDVVQKATASNVTLEVVTTDPVSLSWMRAGHGRREP